MRKNSKTTQLFNNPEFQQYLRDRFSINAMGDLCGTRGQPVRGADAGIGYRIVGTYFRGVNTNILAHRIVMFLHLGRVPGEIDHIDGNRGNNNLFNLREIDHSKNMGRMPKDMSRNFSSQYKGVHQLTKSKAWTAKCAGKHLGYFEYEEDAARAYDHAAYLHFGPDAWLNFPLTPRA